MSQTALIVAVPELESLVSDFRTRYDPASAEGVPAHVTVLFPFVAPESMLPATMLSLREIFEQFPSFSVRFADVRRFPGVLYLPPLPDVKFRRLTECVVNHFPETPPYGGQFPDIVPHLTVAHATDQSQLEAIEADFLQAAKTRWPIDATIREVTLIEKRDGQWRTHRIFPLGGVSASTS
jgi:2'-5' RNA ligase